MLPLRAGKKYQHLLLWPHVLNDGVFIYIRLQWLEPCLVLLRLNGLQPHKYANLVDNGRLAEPPQPVYGRPNGCFYWLGLLALSGVSVGDGLLDVC
jgi:hypothetical protein